MNKNFIYISLLSVFSINLYSEVLEKKENGNYISLTYENTGKTYINEQYLEKDYDNKIKENINDTKYVENNNSVQYIENTNDDTQYEENTNDTQYVENKIVETPENNEMLVEELPKTLKPNIEKELTENNNEEENINMSPVQNNVVYNEIKEFDNTLETMEEEKREEKILFVDNNQKDLKDFNNQPKPKITIFNR